MKREKRDWGPRGLHAGDAGSGQDAVRRSGGLGGTGFCGGAVLILPSGHVALREHVLGRRSPPKEVPPGAAVVREAGGCRRLLARGVRGGGEEAGGAVGEGRGRLALSRAAAFAVLAVGFIIGLLVAVAAVVWGRR